MEAEVRELLRACRQGDAGAFARLIPLLYHDLRRIARCHLRRSGSTLTLDATGLVHECYLKMVHQPQIHCQDRAHFLAVSGRAMRQVIIGHARRRGAVKRGGASDRLTLDENQVAVNQQAERLLALDQALTRLGGHNPRLARIVECRFFAGLSEEEAAAALGVSLRTAQRDWKRARAWLRKELSR